MTQENQKSRLSRVLMYTAYFDPEYSGAALQALTLARELRRRGHDIEFVTNRWPGLAESAIVEGFPVRRLEMGRMKKHREFRLWFNLARYCWQRRRDFDVLHSHGAYFTNAFIGPLARVLGLKSVIKASLAEDDLEDLSRPIIGRIHSFMLKRVDSCIAISRDLVREFGRSGVSKHRIHHIPNGVDVERFHPVTSPMSREVRVRLGIPTDQPVVLYVGVLDQRKNILWLAEQWIANDAFGTGALLLAVGPQGRSDIDGALRARLTGLAQQSPNRLLVHDFHADVAPYFQSADVLILPSVKEGLPNVILEAMACGRPCIAARVSGSQELIVDGHNGYTYAPDCADELGTAIRACLGEQVSILSANAARLAQQQYAIGAVADRYQSIYARLTLPRTRVLFVENGIGYGGAIICLRHLVRNLDRDRFEPMVITGLGDSKYQEIAGEAEWQHIPDKRIDVIAMKRQLAASRWIGLVPGLRWLLNQIISRLDDVANFLPSFVQTLWTLRRFRPHLVHVNNEPLCNRAAVLAGKVMGVPVVAHVRGDQKGSPLMHSFFKLPDYFIAVSNWVSASIGRVGVPVDKRTYIYDGIELDKLDLRADGAAFRRRHKIPENAYVVGLVGLLIPWKGQRLFLEAALRLIPQMPDAVFAIVGGTPDECAYFEAELRQRTTQPDLSGRVVFTGHVSDMACVYNGLDIVLSASTSPEPLGTVVIEAMTMARPLIAPNHGGAVEMVESDVTGMLFKAGDADDLAATILRVYRDPELAKRLGEAARAHALSVFDVNHHVHRVQQVYDKVLGLGRGAAA